MGVIKVIDDYNVIIELVGDSSDVMAWCECIFSTKEIQSITGKFVHISGTAQQVGAFVFSAKPFLRSFSVNGATIISPNL